MSLTSQTETGEIRSYIAVPPDADARRVIVSVNPRAGARCRRQRIEAIGAELLRAGYDVQTTSELTELAELSAQGWQNGMLRAVIAVGGDGTASIVRHHVPLPVPLLPVPLGTENLLGRYVGHRADPFAIREIVRDGVVISLDLGRANGRHFLLMISAGFDAEVVRALHEKRSGNINRSAYLLPALQVIRRYRFPELRLYWDGDDRPQSLCCRWMFGFNLPLYALGLPIAPAAVGTDGLLDVCAFKHGSMWSVMRYMWHVTRGAHQRLADTTTIRCRRVRLEAPDAPQTSYQLDGDHGGLLPVDIEVLPGKLRLLVSRETATRLGFALA
jgi:diacylglycerol kinase (ATP)